VLGEEEVVAPTELLEVELGEPLPAREIPIIEPVGD